MQRALTKTVAVMNLIGIFLLAGAIQVAAAGMGQTVTYSGKSVPLQQVFTSIKKQTGFVFFYDKDVLDEKKKVTVHFDNEELSSALTKILADEPLEFEIQGNTIFITGKKPAVIKPKLELDVPPPPVTGVVKGPDGQPLAGVNIVVKGTKRGTTSSADGVFSIDAKENEVLMISSVGYSSKELKVENNQLGVISLSLSESKLDEVQIIAYGTTSKRLSTANIASVKAEDIAKQPVNNPLLALAGRVPGLQITQATGFAGSAIQVQIQGQNSFAPGVGNAPFYVVDGVPFESQMLPNFGLILGSSPGMVQPNGASGFSGNPLALINPADIESIDVLKDAAATSIYGSRAANGAILITTKKGKVGTTRAEINLQTGIGEVPKKLDLLNTQQYLEVRKEAFKNDGVDFINTFPFNAPAYKEYYAKEILLYDPTRYTDWQEVLIGNTARYHDAQVSLSAGTPTLQYRASATYHKESTVFPTDASDRKVTINFNLSNLSANKKIRFTLGASYLRENNRLPNIDLTQKAMTTAPNAPPIYNADGTLNFAPYTIESINYSFSSFFNPLADLNRLYQSRNSNLVGNAMISYQILNGLEIKTAFGYNRMEVNELLTSPASSQLPESRAVYVRRANYGFNAISSWIAEPQMNYKKLISRGMLDVLIGSSVQQKESDRKALVGTGYRNDLVMENIDAATAVVSPANSSIITQYKYLGIFARINYNYNAKYIVELSARRDGSSRFGAGNKFHNFGAVSGSWIFTNEDFLRGSGILSFGKIRASYGSTGNDQIGEYRYLSLYDNNTVSVPYAGTNGLTPRMLPNPYIQWEVNRKFSIGWDLGFLEDRFLMNITYYKNRSGNKLTSVPLSPNTGHSAITANSPALVQNTGFEFSLATKNVQSKNFQWSTNFNLTIPRNKLVAFPNIEQSGYAKTLVVGKPITYMLLYDFIDLDPLTGLYRYQDKKGDITNLPMFDPDNKTIRVNPEQLLYGGLQNILEFKGISLDILFQLVKQDGFNSYYGFGSPPGTSVDNQPVAVLNRWQKPGDSGPIAQYSASNFAVYYPAYAINESDAAWGNVSYIRLKNASLSWQMPVKLVSKAMLHSARLYIQGQNLMTFSNYRGLDPESKNPFSLPPLRVMTVGMQITL